MRRAGAPLVRRAGQGAADAVGAARMLDRVGTLVAAGVPQSRAWALAGSAGPQADAGPAVRAGPPMSGGPALDDVRAVMAVASRTGAPVAPTLHALASALRRAAAGDRAVRVALAGPRTSANVVLALPVLGLLLGSLWGIDTITVLVGTPIGWACSTGAALLVGVGRVWSSRLVRAATPSGRIPGVLLDAWAVALSGGGSWSRAGDAVRAALPDHADHADHADRVEEVDERRRLGEVLDLARRAGVPAAALLRSAAEDLRDDVASKSLAVAERLAVRLVLPLGTCVLPAFVLVGVVPVVVGILSSTVGGAP